MYCIAIVISHSSVEDHLACSISWLLWIGQQWTLLSKYLWSMYNIWAYDIGHMPRTGIAGSPDRFILSFMRILHCDLLSGNTNLHSLQHWMRLLLSSQSYQHLTSQETSCCVVGQGSLHDSLNNIEYRRNTRLPLRGWWWPLLLKTLHT